jgi:hypothetical protein
VEFRNERPSRVTFDLKPFKGRVELTVVHDDFDEGSKVFESISGGSVRLTMTESHSWDVPDAILAGGRSGWPAVLSSLKSYLETGKSLSMEMSPPPEMIEAVKKAVVEKPWLRR